MAKAKAKANRKRITDLTLKNAAKGGGDRREIVWDTLARGLGLAIHPTGRTSWRFVYRWPPGSKSSKPVWLTWPGLGLADAREKAQEQWRLINAGIDPRGSRQASLQATMTFADLHRRYVDEHSRKTNRRWREIERLVDKHLVTEFGGVPAATVARADARDAIKKIRDAGRDPTANRVMSHGSAIFDWAIKHDVVEMATNPFDNLPRTPRNRKERWLAESEIKAAWPLTFEHGAAGAAIRAMLLTGQRGNEIRRYSPAHVEDGRWWNIPASVYKQKVGHRVYLTDEAKAELAAMKWGKVASLGRRETLMREATEAIRLALTQEKWTPHTCRHTVISHLARMGVHKEVRARVVGHAEGGGVQSDYTHHSFDPEKRQVMARWAGEVRRIIDGRPAEGEVVKLTA
jgi:integrase